VKHDGRYAPIRRSWGFGITRIRVVLMVIVWVGVIAIVYRLAFGLGAATNLSDRWPWGVWVWWDVMTGVALAGGGYSTVLMVHFLGRERWRDVERAAALTSLIGYLLVVGGLGLDLGRWFNAWRPLVSWGYHSVMFELFLCVSGYTFVQVVEFLVVFDERVHLPRILDRLVHRIYAPLLMIGVILPFLHQSALGSLYVIAKGRLDPLWWSMLLPLFFLMSSFYVGPAMVTIESHLAAWGHHRRPPVGILNDMVGVAGRVMAVYLVLRVGDVVVRGQLGHAFDGSVQGDMFLLEVVLGVAVPTFVFLWPGRSDGWLVTASVLCVLGVGLQRADVVFTGMANAAGGASYLPSPIEIAITSGLIAWGILLYLFVVENFPIYSAEEALSAEPGLTLREPPPPRRAAHGAERAA
jgi:Ni/Fe-hydrogenase subunit HybB-like protein